MYGLALQKGRTTGNNRNPMSGGAKCAGVNMEDGNRFECCRDRSKDKKYFQGNGRPVLNTYLTYCQDVLKDSVTINGILCRKCYDRCERQLAPVLAPSTPTPTAAPP